jgi:hypothetical protein
MRFDRAQLVRTLDLWAAMWQPRERAVFAKALERVLVGDVPELKRAALAACHVIATPELLAAAERAVAAGELAPAEAAAIAAEVEPEARVVAHARRFNRDHAGIGFLVHKILREPTNPVADKLLEHVDIRDLWAVLQASDDDAVRAEAARRIARRGPHQRARLCNALDLPALDDALAVNVPLDDMAPAPAIEVALDDLTL